MTFRLARAWIGWCALVGLVASCSSSGGSDGTGGSSATGGGAGSQAAGGKTGSGGGAAGSGGGSAGSGGASASGGSGGGQAVGIDRDVGRLRHPGRGDVEHPPERAHGEHDHHRVDDGRAVRIHARLRGLSVRPIGDDLRAAGRGDDSAHLGDGRRPSLLVERERRIRRRRWNRDRLQPDRNVSHFSIGFCAVPSGNGGSGGASATGGASGSKGTGGAAGVPGVGGQAGGSSSSGAGGSSSSGAGGSSSSGAGGSSSSGAGGSGHRRGRQRGDDRSCR